MSPMATRTPHPDTILHLVPADDKTSAVLLHPDNEPRVSRSRKGKAGLEVGYHVAARPRPETLVEVGRDADLILPGGTISTIQFSFEVHPESKSIMFCDRSRLRTTDIYPIGFRRDGDFRQVVLLPSCDYKISAGGLNRDAYRFDVIWWTTKGKAQAKVERGYQQTAQKPQLPRFAHTIDDSAAEISTWYKTRLHTPNGGAVERFQPISEVGRGSYGVVSRAIDLDSGCFVAAKAISITPQNTQDMIWREVKTLSALSHKNIVEFLGVQGWDTPTIFIFTPLQDGTVTDLFSAQPGLASCERTLSSLLQQMLEALDFLSYRQLIHRDVKPDNILFTKNADDYRFQLADFGLSRQASLAKSVCGTFHYTAPEVYRQQPQTPKVDIWSLFISLLELTKSVVFDSRIHDYPQILSLAQAGLCRKPGLAPMAREDPDIRASAGQLLVLWFDGNGLTTPRSQLGILNPFQFTDTIVLDGSTAALIPQPTLQAADHQVRRNPKRQVKKRSHIQHHVPYFAQAMSYEMTGPFTVSSF